MITIIAGFLLSKLRAACVSPPSCGWRSGGRRARPVSGAAGRLTVAVPLLAQTLPRQPVIQHEAPSALLPSPCCVRLGAPCTPASRTACTASASSHAVQTQGHNVGCTVRPFAASSIQLVQHCSDSAVPNSSSIGSPSNVCARACGDGKRGMGGGDKRTA